MTISQDELREITSTIWSTQLGLELVESRNALDAAGDPDGSTMMTGTIQISGGWSGAVHLFCTRRLVRLAAAVMFATEPQLVSAEDIRDALGELTNMTAGNVKAYLSHEAYISLPTVVEGSDYDLVLLESQVLQEAEFLFEGEPLIVTVLRGRAQQ